MVTKAQLKAAAKYNKDNTVQYCLRLNSKTDKDLINFLATLHNKQGLIKRLLRECSEYAMYSRHL